MARLVVEKAAADRAGAPLDITDQDVADALARGAKTDGRR
jgi:hypothetical protein